MAKRVLIGGFLPSYTHLLKICKYFLLIFNCMIDIFFEKSV